METLLFVCSESAAIDATSALSVFHIMEEVNAVAFPVVVPRFSAIVLLSRREDEPQNPDLQLRISLGEQGLFNGPLNVSFRQHLRTRAIADLFGLLIPAPGDLIVHLRTAHDALGHWSIRINHVGQLGLNVFPAMPPPAHGPEPVHQD